MGLKAKRQIVRRSGTATRMLQDLCDISIDWCALAVLSVLVALTLYNIVLTHAATALRLLGQHASAALMQLALTLP